MDKILNAPAPLRRRLILTVLLGFACLLVGLAMFLFAKDRIMLLLSAAVCILSFCRAYTFYRAISKKEYEVVHEIFNECANNQMRDVFFQEAVIDDLEEYVRSRHKDKDVELKREDLADGTVIYHVNAGGLMQRYTFSEI